VRLCPRRILCLSALALLFSKKNIFHRIWARPLTKPIVLTLLTSNMALLAILTPGGVSTHSPSVLQPPWPNLEPAFKKPPLAAPCRPTDSTSLTNKGPRPSENPADHRIASGDNLVRLSLLLRSPRGPLPGAVALEKPVAAVFIAAAISLKSGCPRGKLRSALYNTVSDILPANLLLRRRQKNRWGG
jgi:hypothetical protein